MSTRNGTHDLLLGLAVVAAMCLVGLVVGLFSHWINIPLVVGFLIGNGFVFGAFCVLYPRSDTTRPTEQ